MSVIRTKPFVILISSLVLMISTVIGVIFVFGQGLDRIFAARIASSLFLFETIVIAVALSPKFYKSLSTLWLANWVFLLVFSGPMATFRIFSDAPFNELNWLGMMGPQLHAYSNYAYISLLLFWAIDLILLIKRT